MGAADVIPGVSGGTMAFILGIYEELIAAIRSFDLVFIQHLFRLELKNALNTVAWRFLFALGLGILAAIFTLAKFLAWLLTAHPIIIWSFFFGLILASIITVNKHIPRWTPPLVLYAILSAAGTFILVGLVPMETPNAPWFLFLAGSIAICAMILPGISGAFILVLLGKYFYVLEAVNQRDFLTLAIVAAGALTGLILFSRFLGWLFRNHHHPTVACLCGLMLGSLRKVWPWKVQGTNVFPSAWSHEVGLAILLGLLGVGLVLSLDWWAAKESE